MSTDKITILLNWSANAYHAPLYLAQKLGYFQDEGISVAILEPSDPSDVTELIGSGRIDMGCKAMIHTIAAKARGFNVTSVGTILDEPFTGIVYLKSQNKITTDFTSLRGKRIGYVGEFGKIIIDELTSHHGMTPADYTAVRVGMNVADAIKRGTIDAGVGLENIQQVDLEHWSEANGRPASDVGMLRIDELADLGCCCFCSVLMIANDEFAAKNPHKVKAVLKALRKAMDLVRADPDKAWEMYVEVKPVLGDAVNRKMFERSLPYFSATLENVQRDWTKVTGYSKRLGVVDASFVQNMTNEFLPENSQREIKANEVKAAAVAKAINSIPAVTAEAGGR
ncbi:glycylpeptide N-tetradecanoyltransferase [Geranomyces variabilis]|uniref:4-amino-5-hydroxymethyl-2-methylpyrimidine phosphate synthase n=1 Tax=Geranomyces variabilis TaxID=109894 RepID=A0AAD5TPW9_9FUNG|nr:glycylpeptide N-tetradecanoyltransferase [Geranomyces variabilis]